MTSKYSEASTVVVMVEDPGALNFLEPLVDRLIEKNVSLVLFGVGVGYRHLRKRGYQINYPPVENDAEQALRDCQCRLLVIGTSEDQHTPAFGLVRAARLAGIPTVGVVDAAVNAQFRFRGISDIPLSHAPDWLIVPDDATADAFDQLGFPRDRICIVGHPGRDLARRRVDVLRSAFGNEGRHWPPDKYRIVFVSELSDGLNQGQYAKSNTYTLTGRGMSSARTAVVAEELLDALSALRDYYDISYSLLLRLHPKQAKSDLGLLIHEFDEVSIGGDPLEVVATADLVVGMTSMLLLQAHDMGLRCLSILPRETERTWQQEISLGLIPSVVDRTSLRAELLNLLLSHPESDIAPEAMEVSTDAVAAMINCLVAIHGPGVINGLC
jgi:hypothetical protein